MEVIIYTSNECNRCKTVKQMLDNHNVKYHEITDRNVMIEKDFAQVPVLQIDGAIIESYGAILNWLDKNGYYEL